MSCWSADRHGSPLSWRRGHPSGTADIRLPPWTSGRGRLEVCDRVNLLAHGTIAFDKPATEASLAELTDLVVAGYRAPAGDGW